MTILRHSSLKGNVMNNWVTFYSWEMNSKIDIHVQKIKVEK